MLPIARAVLMAAWRDIRTLNSIQGNNFFWFIVLLAMQPESMTFFGLLLAVLMLPVILTAPLAKVPAIRMDIWPVALPGKVFYWLLTSPDAKRDSPVWRYLPTLELRQLVRTLDFWLATLLAIAGTLYRLLDPKADPAAFPVFTMVIVLALSTLALNLFAHDGPTGRVFWRRSPARGWRILLRKGLPLLAISLVLTLALSPLGALAGMLAALAIGHHSSVFQPIDAQPWRFTMGQFFPQGLIAVIGLFSCGIASARGEYLFLAIAAATYLGSLLLYGWIFENL